MTEQPYIIGRPYVTIFHNEDNLFTICKCKISKTNSSFDEKEMIVKGNFPRLSPEEEYKFVGRIVEHPKYGLQFDVETFQKEMPSTETGIIQYLSSDLFPGIGTKTAKTIVETLGPDAINRILNDGSVLDQVPRLSSERKETLISVLEQNMGMERTVIQLNEWGFGPKIAMRIYQAYRDEAIEKLTENPYRLAEEIEGVGFQRADELGRQLGMTGNHPSRVEAAVLFVVNDMTQSEGHVFVTAETSLPRIQRLLQQNDRTPITYDDIHQALIRLVEDNKLVIEQKRMYIPSLYYSELGIATKLQTLLENDLEDQFPISEIRSAIGEVEERLEVEYAETQVHAIETALHSPVMVLTGGPGTGKTTVIRGFVEVFAELHGLPLDPEEYAKKKEAFPIVLAAPTGRAAKRMSESTELPAMTIHRLLGFTGQDKEEETEKEVEAKLLIIDEMSMVDTWLMHQLLKALPNDIQVLFVGDQDQLPSVGPGQVLRDLLDSTVIPVVELTEIYRQSAESTIIELAHMIKRSEWTDTVTQKTRDRSFIPTNTQNIQKAIEQIIDAAIAKGHHIRDIQVLAPMYKGPAGIDALNQMIQQLVNPPSANRKEVQFGDVVYRIGDKVLQLVNQPESNVFNGDMGEVISIFKANETVDKKEMIVISFDGNEVTYERKDLNQITLAYCCSIHKSQGSEFSTVIMPIVRSHRKMLRKNLLYTGITRAKHFLILCGEPAEFREGIHRTDELHRQTSLTKRLQIANGMEVEEEIEEQSEKQVEDGQYLKHVDENMDEATNGPAGENAQSMPKEYALTTTTYLSVDPMIGMNGIRLEDFKDEGY